MEMDRIIEHVERLLLRHDCVIIPDFGGFVLQSIPAVYMGDEHSFTPSRKEIVFNPALTHNDGLLTESYMQVYAADFKKALQLVREDVSVMKETLDDDTEFQFGRIGLFMTEDDRILFVPGRSSDLLFSTSSYGLPVFHYLSLASRKPSVGFTDKPVAEDPVVSTIKTEDPPKSKNIIYTIPVTRTFVRVLAVTAVAIILFLLISTPVKDVNKDSYSASFVPQEIMPKKTADEIVSDAFSTADALENVGISDGYVAETGKPEESVSSAEDKINEDLDIKPEWRSDTMAKTPETEPEIHTGGAKTSNTTSPKSPAASSAKSSTEKASSAKTVSKAVSGKYYVIIGSFNTRGQAQGYIKRLESDVASDAGIIMNDGRVRVYAQQFSTGKSAQIYLNKIRQNPKHKQAWLYKGQ
jgi:hypothetical protein